MPGVRLEEAIERLQGQLCEITLMTSGDARIKLMLDGDKGETREVLLPVSIAKQLKIGEQLTLATHIVIERKAAQR